VSVKDSVYLLTLTAVYLPPRYTAKQEQVDSLQEETTMLSIPTGDPGSLHPEDTNYSERWKETTWMT
jgi:hypothetical protein